MEQEDKWKRFAATGRIQDYLDYRQMENASDTKGTLSGRSGEQGGSDLLRTEEKKQNGVIW